MGRPPPRPPAFSDVSSATTAPKASGHLQCPACSVLGAAPGTVRGSCLLLCDVEGSQVRPHKWKDLSRDRDDGGLGVRARLP